MLDVGCWALDVFLHLISSLASLAGKISVNVLPWSTADSTASPASIFLASSYTIESPSPVPRRADNDLVVKNGSNMRGMFSGGIPQPVSRTETVTYSAAVGGASATPAGGAATRWVDNTICLRPDIDSAALKMKFNRIC